MELDSKSQYEQELCLLPYFQELTRKESAEYALNVAKDLKARGMINDCHIPAHTIGNENFKKFSGQEGAAFINCPTGCLEGCFHGVMEEYVKKIGTTEKIVSHLFDICSVVGTTQKLKTICFHGIGHGILLHNPSKIIQATQLCQSIVEIPDRVACLTGVFMENANSYLTLSETKLRSKIPLICQLVANTDNLNMCLQKLGEGLAIFTDNNFTKAREICGEFTDDSHYKECIAGVDSAEQSPMN